jgi:Tripartite tricarboxylate transporter TctB family
VAADHRGGRGDRVIGAPPTDKADRVIGAPPTETTRRRADLLTGAVFVAFGLAFAVASATYEVGTPQRMGPGYFPLVLGGLLALLGVLIIGKGLMAGAGDPVGAVPWRSVVLLLVAVVFFAATIRGLGLVPALFVTTLLAALAGRQTGIGQAIVIAAGLTALSVVIFVLALQLRLSLLGPWVRP